MSKRMLVAPLVTLLAALPGVALAESWGKVSLVDHMCLEKVRADPDAHPRSCLMQCAGSGYGLLTQDGKYLSFDKAGNEKALAALKATSKKDHIRVDVSGSLKGDTIEVTSLKLAD